MIKIIHLFFLLLIFITVSSKENLENLSKENQNEFIVVEIEFGKIRGIIMKSRKSNDIYAFRGIKYAEPPIGDNRFRSPIPFESWNGIYDATKDGWMCPQLSVFIDPSLQDEDCLILNVFSKDLTGNKSVLVYIHGGAFIFGGSHSETSGPQYFLDHDIVLVTINYRVGAFGFLSTNDSYAPGNLAFKDQVLALKWIQKNIKHFGGNPDSVTILGQSAGSMSINLHLVSPMSNGLFHGVIMMSGAITAQYVTENLFWTLKLAEKLRCPLENSIDLLNCLRKIPYKKILEASNQLLTESSFLPWMYEIENSYGQERFLTDNPTKLMASGQINKVPIIIGMTKDEINPLREALGFNLADNFEELAPKYLLYGYKTENSSEITNALKHFYLQDNLTEGTETLLSDAYIRFGVHRMAHLASLYNDVYFYRFDFLGRFSHIYNSDKKPCGVLHSDDLQYIFVNKELAPIFNETDRENIMVERLTHWFTTFAATGNPNSNPNEWTEGCNWPISDSSKLLTLYIDEECHIGDEPYQDRFKLWDELFPIPT